MKHRVFSLNIIVAILSLPVYATQPIAVGKISFAKGSNAAQQPNSAPRLLGKDVEVYQGDNIQTSDSSFVIVEFIDGSKVTVRPNSNFKIEQFDTTNKNAKLTVYEGGVRASTGEFAKTGADNFQIKTPTATLKGDKDSDYSVQVCKEECEKNKKSESGKDNSVAKVVDIKGDVFAENRMDKNITKRKLAIGEGLNQQDYLTSYANSYMVMVFRDGEKITLQANSELDIVKYDYQQAGKKDQILLKLATGGMRALTGSIGKKDHSAYAVDTPVATIGIRGTEYETTCVGDCVGGNADSGMYAHVTEGAISQKNESGEAILKEGQNSFIANQNALAVQIPTLPSTVIEQINNSPSPKTAPDAEKVYRPSSENTKAGSYVTVNKGTGKLETNSLKTSEKTESNSQKNENVKTNNNQTLSLSEGESSFAGESVKTVTKLEESPSFIMQDDVSSPESARQSSTNSSFSLNDNVKGNSAACVVQ